MSCQVSNADVKDLPRCYPVMFQLRPHLSEQQFCERVSKQFQDGYKLVYIADGTAVLAIAGYRELKNLAWGNFIYIDDLVTDAANRSKGLGKVLLDWIINEAKSNKCQQVHLDSGLQRKDAHRFYDREGITFTGRHYAINIAD